MSYRLTSKLMSYSTQELEMMLYYKSKGFPTSMIARHFNLKYHTLRNWFNDPKRIESLRQVSYRA